MPTRTSAASTRVALFSRDAAPGDCVSLVLEFMPGSVDDALGVARRLGKIAPMPGTGSTTDLWEALATLGSIDLSAARAVEPHLDALAILAQAGCASSEATAKTWGVFAAEGGDDPLTATQNGSAWTLSGTKPWCSLADRLSNALITAQLPGGGRGLFAIDLRDRGVAVRENAWHARGLAEIPSGPVALNDVAAEPVGEPGWYLSRAGFAWGGIGVAACWYGGLVGLARSVFDGLGDPPGPLHAMHLGQLDGMVQSARRALAEAAAKIDGGNPGDGAILAKRVRAAVAESCERALVVAGHALGPAPLALDETYAKRVADLQLYIRQHHAEKDDASLGTSLAANGIAPW